MLLVRLDKQVFFPALWKYFSAGNGASPPRKNSPVGLSLRL